MVKVRPSSFAAIAACAALSAACAQLLGIDGVHDDPADAGPDVLVATGDDAAPDTSSPRDGSDAAPDTFIPSTPDADAAPILNPLRGCTDPDGGRVSIFPTVATYPVGVAVDLANVYVADVNGVRRCSLEGCEAGVLTVVSSQTVGLALTDSHVVWANNSNVFVVDQNGFAAGGWLSNGVTHVTTHSNDVYWSGTNAVLLHGNDGPDAQPNVVFAETAGAADSLAANARYLFFVEYGDASSGSLLRCDGPACSGGPTFIASVANVDPSNGLHPALAVTDTTVYWSDPVAQVVRACDVAGCQAGSRTVATGVQATSLFVDATSLYFTTPDFSPAGNGQLHKQRLVGGPDVVLDTFDRYPNHVVANAACIYWTSSGIPSVPRGAVHARPQP